MVFIHIILHKLTRLLASFDINTGCSLKFLVTLKARQWGAFGGPKGVQLEVFRELQGGCSWRLLVGLKSPGLRNSSFQVYYVILLY